MRVLLVSTYELGHQPFGLASPAAWLRAAGHEVVCIDTSRQRLEDRIIAEADAIGVYLPMHTATRLAMPLIDRARRVNPRARLCAFGLYAPLNEVWLRQSGITGVFGGEFEEELTDWIASKVPTSQGPRSSVPGPRVPGSPGPKVPTSEGPRSSVQSPTSQSHGRSDRPLPRLVFRVPDRTGLPALQQYASLQMPDGTRRVAGYTEASRGCKHECRHCPIVPVYEGRFRIVPVDVVMADVRAQVAAGARHITFGDPDFFNGVGHARSIARAFAREAPGVTYDVTIKIEHLLEHADALTALADTGCLMVTSAVESVDDRVLALLQKVHTREDFERAVAVCRAAGLTLAPTFLPFTPWTTPATYLDLLRAIVSLDLVDQVAPIQLAIRLLIPRGSHMLQLDDVRRVIGPFDGRALVFPWQHPDPCVDQLHKDIEAIVGTRLNAPRQSAFARIWNAAHQAADEPVPHLAPRIARAAVPFLTEPWYC